MSNRKMEKCLGIPQPFYIAGKQPVKNFDEWLKDNR